jgi:ribosomal-protein-alanine N-acetyltransferase
VEVPIRAMEAGDLDAVMAMAATLREAPHWPRAAYQAGLHADSLPRRVALVAERAGGLVGFAVASVVAGQAELESVAVAVEAQRQGVATALIGALFAEVRRLGGTKMLLEVRASNGAALRLYERLGFSQTGRRRGYYADPVEDAVLLSLQL